jgi:hypothetical protein
MVVEKYPTEILNSCYPRSQKRDLGHPFVVLMAV